MSEASAAMGLTSLESLDEFVAVNKRHYQRYRGGLDGLPGVTLRDPAAMAGTNYHYVVVEIDPRRAGFSRDVALRVLTAEGVLARRYFYPGCHRLEPYRSIDPASANRLTTTDRVCDRVLQLPTGTAIADADVDGVCGMLRFVSANADQIVERLGGRETGRRGG
jgi:dTDP-4-amino-4,6-dideoxygalactose transaminase